MKYKLDAVDFKLELSLKIWDDIFPCPNDSLLKIYVFSNHFSAETEIDIGVKDFVEFAVKLKYMYDNLKGEAKITEAYSDRNFINFSVDKRGYFRITGRLYGMKEFCTQKIEFENDVEQTYIRDFAYSLYKDYV